MTNDALTHERCSELLGDFAGGRLDAAEAARVEGHLQTCPDCSSELQAVMALQVEDEPLTDLERARIRRGVSEQLGDVIPDRPKTSRTRARLATALGAAALLAIVGVAVLSLGSGGDDGDEPAGALSGVSDQGQGAGTDTNTAAGGAAEAQKAPVPRPSFDDDAGRLSDKKFRRVVATDSVLSSFSSAYSADDATRLKDEYVSELANQASSPVQDLIRNCAEKVYEGNQFALPAYAARGRLQGREALVLGFAWTDDQAGPLDQFMLWTWPQSSCDAPIDYRSGQLSPRK